MSVSFKLRTQKSEGIAPLYARIQAPSLDVNLLLSDCSTLNVPPVAESNVQSNSSINQKV